MGWALAEAAAARAADSGNLQGLRDAAIILVMSDTLARISEVVALQCSVIRKRVAAVPGSGGRVGGHSFRVGSARELAAAGASVAELQQAGGGRSPDTPEVYIRLKAARGPVARVATGWARCCISALLNPDALPCSASFLVTFSMNGLL